ncbi:serine carboxypeptidase-like 18 isoform X2 [Ziziphus jujuba]|uniref:Serine carboxypeptidase-like 18 isoform X2 n=1 Tax=Ziziphus jujuba TaxID=326968 RepID=A0A6P4AW83_ZIZJJ|nr:serine carboxypeptidase-like 18 isoform X2 [Ziziphus jujuba]
MAFASSIQFCSLQWLLILLCLGNTFSQSIVKTLPGFSGLLPFKLETGYVNVERSEFFYYFVESQGNPLTDPLILLQIGGPGCTGLTGLFNQIGPLAFDSSTYQAALPSLKLVPNSWTQIASIIFIDAPIGTGFSYSTCAEDYIVSSDTNTASMLGKFIRKWLEGHLRFKANPFFVGGDSYGGLLAPIITREIVEGNKAGLEPFINLEGYYVGSPHTDTNLEENSKIPYAYGMGLISSRLFERAKRSCKGEYLNVEPTNLKCLEDLAKISECTGNLNIHHILRPNCSLSLPMPNKDKQARRSIEETNSRYNRHRYLNFWCKGTVTEWTRCNDSVTYGSYIYDVESAIGYHKYLTDTRIKVLIYTGDHDMRVTHISTEEWIKSLNLTIDDDWRAWYINGQIAGYTETYKKSKYSLTYATVKGAGHSPTEYKKAECYGMFERWINNYPL